MYTVKIRNELCKGCLYCEANCPKKVYELSIKTNDKGYRYMAAVRTEDCIGCKICTTMCPDGAIELYKEVE